MATASPVTAASQSGTTAVRLASGPAAWQADLDPAAGGAGQHPTPHQLLDSALAACTLLTLQLYARRKQYPLEAAQVEVQHQEGGGVYRLDRRVALQGPLDDAQRADLLRVANACPVHKALQNRFEIATTLA